MKKLFYKFTWCDFITPCPYLNTNKDNDIMIGDYFCIMSCPHCLDTNVIKSALDKDNITPDNNKYYRRYFDIGEGYVICNHPNNNNKNKTKLWKQKKNQYCIISKVIKYEVKKLLKLLQIKAVKMKLNMKEMMKL